MFDLRLLNGDIYDGTGSPSFRADIGITADRITAVGDLSAAESRNTLDLSPFPTEHRTPNTEDSSPPLAVAPGFIDVHTHSDVYLMVEPSAVSKLFQGVTTEVVGNCGTSAAPLVGEYRLPSDWADKPLPGPWSGVAEYRERVEAARPAVNVVLLIGHNALRAGVVGYANRPATEDELDRMAALLEKSLEEGGSGLSSGLIYPPGLFAPREELVRLAGVVARCEGIYSSHIRNEAGRLLDAVDEALDIGRRTGVRVEISHLKAAGKENWPLAERAVTRLRAARDSGRDVAADRYPYLAGSTSLDVVFPDWAQEGDRDTRLARLDDPATCDRLRDELKELGGGRDWSGIVIGSTTHPDNERFRGMRLTDVCEELGMAPVEAILHLGRTDRLATGAFFFGQSEENMMMILAEPYVMIGSDASLRAPTGPLSEDYPHPRGYGTFPKFLRMSLDGKTVPLEEAVRKMTSLPADHFRLQDRGRIAEGLLADIVVFDPERVRDTASYGNPHQLAVGIEHVIVNGELPLTGGALTGSRSGRFLAP